MPIKILSETDIANVAARANGTGHKSELEVLGVEDLMGLKTVESKMLIETILPTPGAVLVYGKQKSGKTVLAIQKAIAIASGKPMMDYYSISAGGPVMIIEQDDPNGAGSVQEILKRSPIPWQGLPFHFVREVPVPFGDDFIDLLETQIRKLGLRFVVLDSYTIMRPPRNGSTDIVKAEHRDLSQIDKLGKRTESTIEIVHHDSKSAAKLETFDQAAGTYAMGMAVEAQISISRFADLGGKASERLVKIRGRHMGDVELVVRFRAKTLDYEHVLEGDAAPFYPLLLQIRGFSKKEAFSPKDFCQETGASPATAHRHLDRLCRAGALTKRGFGEYVLAINGLK